MILLHGAGVADIEITLLFFFLSYVALVGFITFGVWLYDEAKAIHQPTIKRNNYLGIFVSVFFGGIFLFILLGIINSFAPK